MFTLMIFVLIAVTLILLSIFAVGLSELHKQEQEDKKNMVREGIEGYLDQIFGYGLAKIFKSIYDADGNLGYVVYLPQYEWFKSTHYKWFEVFETNHGYQHVEIHR